MNTIFKISSLYFIFIWDLLPVLNVNAQQRPRILEHPADAVAAREEPLTLNCKAAGRPPPDISWYHNGTPLVPSERRVILPEGSLFFLRVMQNKREQDAGVYWCEARSTAGVAVSRNATLQIAMLKDEFRSIPKDTVALVGGPVVLNCTPPRGIPEPSVLWYMNGKLLDLSGKRLSLVDSGSLMISEVHAADAGKYECSAQSMAGSKASPTATLKVLAPPTVIRGPQDTEVIEGEGLDLACELTGDPKPIVAWQRENGILPEGRSRVLLDNTLRIEDTRPEDQGRYICKGHNEGGNVSVTVKLYVYATPSFIEAPSDVKINFGGSIKLPCRAQGRPKTRIVWDRVGWQHPDSILQFNKQKMLDIHHSKQNTNINNNNYENGSQFLEEESQEELLAKAKIMSLRSKRGDENDGKKSENILGKLQPLSNDTVIQLDKKQRIKRNIIVNSINIHPTKLEHIPDLYLDDTNFRNKRDQQENEQASLQQQSNFLISEFRQIMRDADQQTFNPNFRRKKRDINIDKNGIDEHSNGNVDDIMNADNIIGTNNDGTIDEDSGDVDDDDDDDNDSDDDDEDNEGRGGNDSTNGNIHNNNNKQETSILSFSTPAPTELPTLEVNEFGELVLRDVTLNDQGWYACAALNEAGSIVKKVFVRVIKSNTRDVVEKNDDDGDGDIDDDDDDNDDDGNVQSPEPPGNRWGANEQNVMINTVKATKSNALDIHWETTDGIPSTSLTLHYRGNGSKEFMTTLQVMSDIKQYTINELRAHAEYEIFATLQNGLGGSVSNIRKGKTLDGPPSAPPTDVRVGVINNTAAYVRWSPPPIDMLNGELTGYKIQIKSNTTNKLLGQMSLNASTQSVVINSLMPGGRYVARVAPLTSGGLGPYSPPAALHMDPSFIARPPKTDPAASGWAISWMSAIALGILVVCLVGGAIFVVIWAKRNKRNMKASYPGPSLTATLPDKQHSLWLHGNTLLKPMHSLAPPQITSEYAEVTQTIIPKISNQAPPEPYATVTLQRGIGGNICNGGNGIMNGIIGNNINCGNGAQSDDSCIKCSASPSSSEYNAPQIIREPLNLCDVLPPPPDHPYSSYKPPNNMTIRTNPAAMSPQITRRTPATPPRWGIGIPPQNVSALAINVQTGTINQQHLQQQQQLIQQQIPQQFHNQKPPPIPTFPQNWIPADASRQLMPKDVDNNQDLYSENDYESGSMLYEQCCRQNNKVLGGGENDHEFFNRGGEPTEEYYRNINLEFLEHQDFEPSTPPQPLHQPSSISASSSAVCPPISADSYNRGLNTNLRLLKQNSINNNNNSSSNSNINCNNQDSPMISRRHLQQQQQQQQQQLRNNNNTNQQQYQLYQQQQQQLQPQQLIPNCSTPSTGGGCGAQSSDDSESDNRWAPRSRRSRSRSKSGDRKYRNNIR